jgi:hypothetical protein
LPALRGASPGPPARRLQPARGPAEATFSGTYTLNPRLLAQAL